MKFHRHLLIFMIVFIGIPAIFTNDPYMRLSVAILALYYLHVSHMDEHHEA